MLEIVVTLTVTLRKVLVLVVKQARLAKQVQVPGCCVTFEKPLTLLIWIKSMVASQLQDALQESKTQLRLCRQCGHVIDEQTLLR